MTSSTKRRRLLAAFAATDLAGCLTGADDDGDEDGSDGSDGNAGDTTSDQANGGTADDVTTATDGGTTGTDGGDLDLREANVTGVELEDASDGTRFAVTLYHDDDGEGGYANWWVVETRGGEELGRRELLHAHGTQEFTRSATISVPGDVDCVVVRGHDQTHGYGGQAAIVRVPSGAVRFERQGSAKTSFAGASCP